MSGTPEGFTFTIRKRGDVVVTHHGAEAAVLRGSRRPACTSPWSAATRSSSGHA